MGKKKKDGETRAPKGPRIVARYMPVYPVGGCSWKPTELARTESKAQKMFFAHAVADHRVARPVRAERIVTTRLLAD